MSPACPCHGEQMLWNKDVRYHAGGFWHCAIVARERQIRDYHDPKNSGRVLRKLMRQQIQRHEERLKQLRVAP